ncbi:mitochondrial carrier [Macrolepiota fuliginosa MF-IS2]|uniref:Mitochondrial carrier n=1 Tax=Macrolepiota fuliginosa MF-IS2 TaxID=1400762 RepID=A0A9P5XGP7_9AGAR|nr:mitochondrial carrier [Macrolepiota fuliginosa MF-IS2]
MASQPPPPADEQQPLLVKLLDEENVIIQEDVGEAVSPQDTPDDSADARGKDVEWSKSSVAWYTGLIVVGMVALGLLIKGLIESGDTDFDFKKAFKSALGGGLSGAAAMVVQVLTLMPLRTIMNYQYRYSTSTTVAARTLYNSGGWARYYQGLTAALVQGPVSRFGDTAANAGILALLNSNTYMRELPEYVKTIFASLAAAAFRMTLTPIDTLKTTLQTQGKPGIRILKNRIRRYGIGTLWYGALATAAATFVGYYPWFSTYNYLQRALPPAETTLQKLARQAFIGFVASIVSDTVSNSLRVLKTYRQVNETRIGYLNAANAVITADGWKGLFGRGLKTRILANGLQGLMFSVLWKFFMDLWDKKHE